MCVTAVAGNGHHPGDVSRHGSFLVCLAMSACVFRACTQMQPSISTLVFMIHEDKCQGKLYDSGAVSGRPVG